MTTGSNRRDSSPSFYLGGNGPGRYWVEPTPAPTPQATAAPGYWQTSDDVEVDAGLQYDWGEFRTLGIPPGWVAFISVNRRQTNPSVVAKNATGQNAWGVWRGQNTSYNLTYKATDQGYISLSVSGLGTFYWSPMDGPTSGALTDDPEGTIWEDEITASWVMNPSQLQQNAVKRVIAMTRSTPPAGISEHVPDGSWMYCTFSSGSVVSIATGPRASEPWTQFIIDQTATGYDTPGNPPAIPPPAGTAGVDAYDSIWNSHLTSFSRFKVDFPNLNAGPPPPPSNEVARTDSTASRGATESGVSRYQKETVHINLRSSTRPVGLPVTVGP